MLLFLSNTPGCVFNFMLNSDISIPSKLCSRKQNVFMDTGHNGLAV